MKPEKLGTVAVRRNVTLFAVIGAASVGLSYAFLSRGSGALDLALGGLLLLVGVVHLFALVGARNPLMVADDEGVSVRVGLRWVELPWTSVRQVVVEQPDSWLRDGRVVVQPRSPDDLSGLGLFGRIHTVWSRRWYGAPLGVPIAMTTTSSSDDVVGDLGRLADGRTDVVALRGRHLVSLSEVPARIGALVSRVGHGRSHDVDAPPAIDTRDTSEDLTPARKRFSFGKGAGEPAPDVPAAAADVEPADEAVVEPAAPPVEPARALLSPRRAEVTREVPASPGHLPEDAPALDEVAPVAVADDRAVRLVFDDTTQAARVEPAPEPVIGTQLASARRTLKLSIDELSDRTRIRPHVLEAMEVDDFTPCGGDFYARGHLATVASVLGVDLAPLLHEYEERYASGPINARRVFEAELATGLSGGMRATVGGPKWSLLVAAVLCLMLVWGVARLFTDTPEEIALPDASTSSAGLAANEEPITSAKMETRKMTVHASFADANVVVKDRTGKVLWSGALPQGDKRQVAGLAPFTVESDNAGAVEVTFMGKPKGTLGVAGAEGSRKFG